MKKNRLLINCDMGEWDAPHLTNLDHEIMPYIDLCNIACGGHAGSILIMNQTIEIAKTEGVKVGAHPGYNDRVNFGRKYQPVSKEELMEMLVDQIDLFIRICDQVGVDVFHIKPHGALYHACNHRVSEMSVLIYLMKERYRHIPLLVFPNSLLHKKALEENIPVLTESFVDRRYTDDLLLMKRGESGSVITSADDALIQYQALSTGSVNVGSVTYDLSSQTTCIHGDNPNVMNILKTIRKNG